MSDNKIVSIINLILNDVNLGNFFRLNLMTKDIEFTKETVWGETGILTDKSLVHLKYYLSYTHHKEYHRQSLEEAVIILADRNKYDPLRDYIKGLKWDGVERIDSWLIDICGVEDNQYSRDVGRKVLCSAIKRALEPGCKCDSMLILEGSQGLGKSTLVDVLGGKWYLDTSLSASESKKEIVDQMRTAWFIEISDLAGFRKHDVEYLKHFLSDASDRVRLPYARRSEDFPRRCIFIGTHNPSGDNEYFRDDTGNRRFWPVECKKIEIQKLKDCREQLFAEALVKYKDEPLYLDNADSLKTFDDMQKSRQIETPLNGMMEEYLVGKDYVHNKEIMEKVFNLNVGRLSFTELRSKCMVIGIYMRKTGWVRGSNKKRGWYFKPGFEYVDLPKIEEQVAWEE